MSSQVFDTPLLFSAALVIVVVGIRNLAHHLLIFVGFAPHKVKLPGPRPTPLVGNLIDLRKGHARVLGEWAQKYGPMMRIVIGVREAVVLNTYSAVHKTFVSQGAAFQGRPEFHLWHGIFAQALDEGAPPTIGTSPYSDRVAMYRKQLTAQTATVRDRRYNHFAARRLYRLVSLLGRDHMKGPRDLGFYLWTTASGLSADMLFGEHLDETLTRHVAEVEILVFRQRTLGQPLYDVIPLLTALHDAARHAATLLRTLGMGTWLDELDVAEANAERLRKQEVCYCTQLAAELHERIRAGDTTPSQLGDLIRAMGNKLTPHDEVRLTTTLIGSGMGVGTVLTWLLSRLAAEPDLQEKAHMAIREVYGDEMPDPLETDRVEYIKALGLEAGRYFTTARLGFPRETTEDVDIEGVVIPAGTIVMHNSFWVNRDESRYDNVDSFVPERWMEGRYGNSSQTTERIGVPHLNHGAGRRYCLGIPYVNKMLYGSLILVLHFFDLDRAPLDEEGLAEVFPDFRSAEESSWRMDPIADQISECDAQALPKASGVRLRPRDRGALQWWISEGHVHLDQFDRPDESITAAGEAEG
ncbi:cytochrome P450 [Daedalea quercina L-15889]|uniref:Cytochrome P450 n=1 Tax=Daedalea quercina L-15889 TaxID=1314783 RepID=A0A165LQ78_9APHY|nr:cytochrome P450 [Daedalea quercina L-15889]